MVVSSVVCCAACSLHVFLVLLAVVVATHSHVENVKAERHGGRINRQGRRVDIALAWIYYGHLPALFYNTFL